MLPKRAVFPHLCRVLRPLNVITPAAKTPRRGRWIKRLGLAVALYTIFEFLLLPAIIKWQMGKQLPVLTHRTARVLAWMESALFQQIKISDQDLQERAQARAPVGQRRLLKTEKVTGDQLFILAAKPTDTASKGQSRVNLSLN